MRTSKESSKIRIVILGNQCVGKSSIVKRYLQDHFYDETEVLFSNMKSTTNPDSVTKSVRHNWK